VATVSEPATAEAEVHELERERHDRTPRRREADSDDILPERQIGGDLPVVFREGEGFIGPFERANRKLSKGIGGLKGYLLPFKIYTNRRGPVEIRRNSKFYFEDIEGHVRLKTVRIDSEGKLSVRLEETGANFPKQSWTFRTIDLARYLESSRLQTMEEVNERAEELLTSLRNGSQAGDGDA
jgi:hypothetical protein